jgi:hypothetical protein
MPGALPAPRPGLLPVPAASPFALPSPTTAP